MSLIEPSRIQLSRSDSFSTIASSAAAEWTRRNQPGPSGRQNNFIEALKAKQSNVVIEGSKTIRIGDIIHNHFVSPSREGFRNSRENFHGLIVICLIVFLLGLPNNETIQNQNRTRNKILTQRISPRSSMKASNMKFLKWKKIFKQKRFIFAFISVTALLGVVASFTILYFNQNSVEGETTIEPQTETTSLTDSTMDSTQDSTISSTESTSEKPTTSITSTSSSTKNPDSFAVMDRSDWEADQPKSGIKRLKDLPIKRIIIAHTGGEFCNNKVRTKSCLLNLTLH